MTQNKLSPTLVIFCKRPLIGQGKQRLAATLGKPIAFELAKRMLDCAIEDANHWQGDVVLAVSSEADSDWADSLMQRDYKVIPQPKGNLGQRINQLDTTLRTLGHHSLVFIGTDAPILNDDDYQTIIQHLSQNDCAFSPATDGGVTIMANKKPWPNLTHLSWSTSTLGHELSDLCKQHSWSQGLIRETYDIDIEEDLLKLKSALENDTRPARKKLLNVITSNTPAT
ncbi:DUF2064 domain-containing protein [Alteromonas sp. 5E99-2]|uniref:TIGR04282 family arsenosugar biosynthesis glycosyltransferase n=1 Tax=Alteromonas sp. 5E99-2 TaxID=2817683 RepID=UPI001A99FC8F|nr:DUF2064 domain-containing protein [Alteromonas sp. 5E99-2]MBO1256583.1 DUF2064 domain-containing protein [Alteromonas sp. 5E99-2]